MMPVLLLDRPIFVSGNDGNKIVGAFAQSEPREVRPSVVYGTIE